MHNVSHEISGDKLIITVDIGKSSLSAAPPSKSGKTKLVASTGGSTSAGGVSYSLNVMSK